MKRTAFLVSRVALAVTLAVALGAGASAVSAEDFEFEVPVQLSKLDSAFTGGSVHCQVHGIGRSPSGEPQGGRALIGSGSGAFAIVQGGFNGTVAVKFNALRPQHEPADGRSWTCLLNIAASGGNQALCLIDSATGQTVGRPPAFLKLDPKTLHACAQGTIGPQTKKLP